MTATPWTMLQRRLVSRYDDLKKRLARHLGSTVLADDALQDTWLRLERGGEITTVSSPDSYLFRIAVNIARDHLRAENRRLSTTEVEVLLNIADETPDAAQILEARSDLEALKGVMSELPARQRAILIAARIEGMSRRDIAQRFGVSVRLIQRELQEAQDYCGARLRNLTVTRYGSLSRETSLAKEPLKVASREQYRQEQTNDE